MLPFETENLDTRLLSHSGLNIQELKCLPHLKYKKITVYDFSFFPLKSSRGENGNQAYSRDTSGIFMLPIFFVMNEDITDRK